MFPDGGQDFRSHPFLERLRLRLGAAERRVVKPGFVDDGDFSSTTHRIGGLCFVGFVIIQPGSHTVGFGIPENFRDIFCDKPRLIVDVFSGYYPYLGSNDPIRTVPGVILRSA